MLISNLFHTEEHLVNQVDDSTKFLEASKAGDLDLVKVRLTEPLMFEIGINLCKG